MNSNIETIDHVFQKYGQPLTDSWHTYAMLRTLGLFLSFLASSVICYLTTKYLIKEVKRKKEIEILGKDYKIAILGAISFMTALGAISIIPSLITATIAPDMYWLVELISK